MSFAPEYVAFVLRENFEDAKSDDDIKRKLQGLGYIS